MNVPFFVVGGHVLSSRDCRDGTERRGNPNCARDGHLTRNFRGSGGGKDPHLIPRSGLVEKSLVWTAILVSLRDSLHVAQLVFLSV